MAKYKKNLRKFFLELNENVFKNLKTNDDQLSKNS